MIGFMVNDLSQSQLLGELFDSVRKHKTDAVVFARAIAPCWDDPPCGVFSWADAWGADFPVVATDLDGAYQLQRFPATPRKIFYAYDLEWLRHHRWGLPPYHALRGVYADPGFSLVCRNADHARSVARGWNVAVKGVSPACDAGWFLNFSKNLSI